MKSFRVLEYASENGRLPEEIVTYFPAFPGIFIDLNREVDVNDCDHYLGVTGLGCEYYLKNGQFSKLFLDSSYTYPLELMTDLLEEVIRNRMNGAMTGHQITSYKNARCFNPEKILVNEDFNLIQFFFSQPKKGESLEEQIESLIDLKISRSVTLGITNRNELVSITVADFAKRIEHNGILLEKEIDGNPDRFDCLVQLIQRSLDPDIRREEFKKLATNYVKKFKLSEAGRNPSSTDRDLLACLELERWG